MLKTSLVLSSAKKAKEVAEDKFKAKDLKAAIKYATMAKQLDPNTDNIDATLVAYKIHLVASKKRDNGETDWCKVLGVTDASVDFETMKKQYKKMAMMVNPNKNGSLAAEGAFRLITHAWKTILNPSHRSVHDFGSASCLHTPKLARRGSRSQEAPCTSVRAGKVERKVCPRCSRWCKYESGKGSVIVTCPNCGRKFDTRTSSASSALSSSVRTNWRSNRFSIVSI